MRQFLIITNDRSKFSAFSEGLAADPSDRLDWAESVKTALTRIADRAPNLVIIDEAVDEIPGLEIAREIIWVNAAVDLAVVSSLSDEAFHEAAEGLGINCRIPPFPQKQLAAAVLKALDRRTESG